MTTESFRFNDGAAYERYMGQWSRLAGESFLQWLAPKPGLRWLDIGCGNGAFTELFAGRCSPAGIAGIDPSEEQLAFARTRAALKSADFRKADAMALPFAPASFDVAVMPLVIFFVPEPAQGVAEMARVVAPGGWVAAYAWDIPGGGFPYAALKEEMHAAGIPTPVEPHPEASRLDVLQSLWQGAGLEAVETRVITVQRTFSDFADYWAVVLGGPSMGPRLRALSPDAAAQLQARLRQRLPADGAGRLTLSGRAHAIRGRVKGK